jgi:hypothetical protein
LRDLSTGWNEISFPSLLQQIDEANGSSTQCHGGGGRKIDDGWDKAKNRRRREKRHLESNFHEWLQSPTHDHRSRSPMISPLPPPEPTELATIRLCLQPCPNIAMSQKNKT